MYPKRYFLKETWISKNLNLQKDDLSIHTRRENEDYDKPISRQQRAAKRKRKFKHIQKISKTSSRKKSKKAKKDRSPIVRQNNCINSECYAKTVEWSLIIKNQVTNTLKRATRYRSFILKAGVCFHLIVF